MRRACTHLAHICLAILLVAVVAAPARAWADELYRVYNPQTGEHLYTTHPEEVSHLQGLGWNKESDQTAQLPSSGVPVWRLYFPGNGDHHYTSDAHEARVLTGERGWVYDFSGNPAFYGAASGVPYYRIYNTRAPRFGHLFTADSNERNHWLAAGGWNDEGICWYANGRKPSGAGVAAPSSAGALQVRGGRLCDRNGSPVQLRGISTHGLAWFPQYVNPQLFHELRTQWNANVVRLALYTDEYNGYCTGGDQGQLRDLVRRGVGYAAQNDMYAIVDWHTLNGTGSNPLNHVGDAKAYFGQMSRDLTGNNNVIYEICNEPNGGTSWAQIKSYAEQVIPVIRANDPDAVVIVGTPTWSQEVDKPLSDPLRFDNVMYAIHFYAATHVAGQSVYNNMVRCAQAGLPIFCSEFGICDASGSGAINEASADEWVSTMNSLGISYCMWSLCNKAESASAIRSDVGKTSGFSSGDLTQSGRWLLRTLTGSLSYAKLSSASAGAPSGGAGGSGQRKASVANGTGYTVKSGQLTCTLTMSNSWQDGGQTVYQYDMSIRNNGSPVGSWSVDVPFSQAIGLVNGWNGKYSADGSRLHVSNESYNGSIPAGGQVSGVGFQVKAGSGLSVG